MKNKFTLVCACLIHFIVFVNINFGSAQDCGTTITPKQSEELEQMLKSSKNLRNSNVLVNIPVKFHVFRRSDGTGGMNEEQVEDLLNQVNDYYIRANMQFFQEGEINFVDDSDVYDFNADSEGDATVGNTVSGVINLYFFNSIQLGGSPLCGYTRFPPSADRVFNVYSCVLNGRTTLEHELGHYFTLYHTHGTTNTGTTDELVDQSNCSNAGDRICDTPADPNLSGQVDNNCSYIGSATDANGDKYTPDPSNVMSYSAANCRDTFSQGQFDRIRNGFENGRGYLKYTSDSFIATFSSNIRDVCVGESTRFRLNSFGATSYEWEFEGGQPASSNSENPEVLYTTAGNYEVKLTVFNNAGQSYTVSRDRYVRVNDPSLTAISDDLIVNFESESDLESNFKISNPDNSITFEQKELILNGENEGVISVNNFNYVTESLPQNDVISTLSYDNIGVKKYTIEFEYAYNFITRGTGSLAQTVTDSLAITVGNECEGVFNTIFKKGGSNLSTTDVLTDEEFIPSSSEEFQTVSLEYKPTDIQEFLLFRFNNISYNGNNLYIKNINITPDYSLDSPSNFRFVRVENDSLVFRWIDNSINETAFVLEASDDGTNFSEEFEISSESQLYKLPSDALGDIRFFRLKAVGVKGFESDYTEVVEISENILSNPDLLDGKLSIYPNPVANSLNIELQDLNFRGHFKLVSVQGATLLEGPVEENSQIDLSNINSGIIFVRLYDDKNQFLTIKKIIKL